MSEKLKNLLSDIVFENEFISPSLQTILKSCKEYQNFGNKDAAFISQISANLSANINIEQNHLLLHTVIQQCSEEVLLSNAISWMSFCIKSSDSFSASIQSIDYTNLYLLITKTQHSNDVKKQFVASILPKFVLKLDGVSAISSVCIAKLKCLEKVLKYYNGPCFSHYKSVERFLLQCIESWHSQDTILFHVGLCYASLSQLGGGGHQTSMYRDNWLSRLCKLVKYCHEVLDGVFEDVPEIQTVPIPDSVRTLEVSIPFSSYYPNTRDTSKLHASQHLLRAFKVLSILVQTHLATPFPAPKMINVEAVLSVVARTLSITPPVLSNLDVTSGHAITLSMLPELHKQSHAMLRTLITVGGRNLIPHSLYICKLTVHTLKWTNTDEAGRYSLDRPFRVLRCAAYETLHKWLTLADYSSNIELMAEELVGYLLADIIYDKPPVTLTAVTKKTRKKHKTKVGLETEKRPVVDLGGSSELRERDPGADVCALAHLVLSDLLKAAGMLLKHDLLKNIQTQIAGLLLPLCTGSSVPPYSSCAVSRRTLYSSVEALLLYSHPQVPDLSHYATVFFHAGLHDSHTEIRQVCQRAIEVLEKLHHPKADSLNFVMENLEEEKLKLIGALAGDKSVEMTNGMNGDVESEEEKDGEEEMESAKRSKQKGKDSAKRNEDVGRNETNKRKRKEKAEEVDERKSKKLKESKGHGEAIKKDENKEGERKKDRKEKRETQLALFDGSKKRKHKKKTETMLEILNDSMSESDESDDVRFESDGASSYEDSDDMAMMMNMMVNGEELSSDFDSDGSDDSDDFDDDDDDSSMDDSYVDSDSDGNCFMGGFSVDTSMLDGSGVPIQWNSNSDESDSSESDNSREGVVITEIVDTTVAIGKDYAERTNETGKGKVKDEDGQTFKDDQKSKKEEKLKKKSRSSTESEKESPSKRKDSGKGKYNKAVEREDESAGGRSKDKDSASKHQRGGNERCSKESNENSDIEMIELDNDESDNVVGDDDVSKTDDKAVESKTADDTNEEITLSSDSQEEDEIEVDSGKDKGKISDEKKVEEVRIESEEDEEEAEEIDDCLKLFNVE